MRGIVKLSLVLLAALLVGGFMVVAIIRTRQAANRIKCANNLRQIGLALQSYNEVYGCFPTGTVFNPDLSPDRRLSWLVKIYPAFIDGGASSEFDLSKAWDAPENCPPRFYFKRVTQENELGYEEGSGAEAWFLQCPSNHQRGDPDYPTPTHYLGIAGLGEDAAELPITDPRAGFFGYDRKLTRENIKEGTSRTCVVAEATDGGPWTAGGRATVRGVSIGETPCFGEAGQFTSLHRAGGIFSWSRPVATNILMADASVRGITEKTSPQVVEELVSIAGKDRFDW